MADNPKGEATKDYTMGYSDEFLRFLNIRRAETHAAYLLPFLKPGMRVLDVGCGPGTISVGLAAAVDPGEFIGVDSEESQVETATAAALEGGHDNARFQVADALNLPFPDNHFDALHCHAVLTHIPDTMAAITEFKRVLKPGGVFGSREMIGTGFYEPNIGDLNESGRVFFGMLIANGGHPRVGRELRARLHEAGFTDIEANVDFESHGTPEKIAAYTSVVLGVTLGAKVAEQAIAKGIATQDEIDGWRQAVTEWQANPGAFHGGGWAVTVGHKP